MSAEEIFVARDEKHRMHPSTLIGHLERSGFVTNLEQRETYSERVIVFAGEPFTHLELMLDRGGLACGAFLRVGVASPTFIRDLTAAFLGVGWDREAVE